MMICRVVNSGSFSQIDRFLSVNLELTISLYLQHFCCCIKIRSIFDASDTNIHRIVKMGAKIENLE